MPRRSATACYLYPKRSILLGFDEFTPAQAALLSALAKHGPDACHLKITAAQNKAVLWKSTDSKDELVKMARWVRHWFEKDPDSTIAIVVHDLETKRALIERHLEEILTPGDSTQIKPWNISMGIPLSRIPMIESAFDLLKLLDNRIEIQDIGRVLRSPWLRGAVAERNSRALLEKCLRDKYPRQLKPGEVLYRASEIKKHDHRHNELPEDQHEPQIWNCPQLTAVLNTLKRFDAHSKGQRLASDWAESFDQLLVSLGWPLSKETGNELPGRGANPGTGPQLAGPAGLAGMLARAGFAGRHGAQAGAQSRNQPAQTGLQGKDFPATHSHCTHPGTGSVRGQRTAFRPFVGAWSAQR